MEQKLKKVLQYFSFFDYYPTFEEIYTFFPVKISKKKLKMIFEAKKYTVGEYNKTSQKSKVKSQKLKSKVKSNNVTIEQWNNLFKRQQISKNKLNSLRFKLYIKFLSFFPQIKLIGLSGSIAMMNADLDDDIDLFIITSKNRLFTARFLATIFAFIMGLKRKKGLQKAPGKVCLNLFFDESDLRVPKFKQIEYVAHEILQMKPIIIKSNVYEQFLKANDWVLKLFPNAALPVILRVKPEGSLAYARKSETSSEILHFVQNDKVGDCLENLLKNLQLSLIRRHKTTEIITDSQLWFHPVDFGKKIKTMSLRTL